MFPLFDKATVQAVGVKNALASQLVIGIGINEDLIPGSQEWWDAKIKASNDAWREAQRTAISQSITGLSTQGLTADEKEVAANFLRRNAEIANQFARADTPEALAEAEIAQDLLMDELLFFLDNVGTGATQIEQSMKALQQEVSQLERDLATGRTPASSEAGRRFGIARKARAQAEQIAAQGLDTPQEIEAYNAALEVADQNQLAGIDALQAGLERQKACSELIQDPATRLAAEAKNLQQQIELLVDNQQTGTAEYLDLVDQLAAVNHEAAEVAHRERDPAAQRNVDMADSLAEYRGAEEALWRSWARA